MDFLASENSFIHFDIYYKKLESLIKNYGYEYKRGPNDLSVESLQDKIGYYIYDNKYGAGYPGRNTYPIPLLMGSSIGCSYGVHLFIFKLINFSDESCIGFIEESNINLCSQNISNVDLNKRVYREAKIIADLFGYFWQSRMDEAVVKSKIILNDEYDRNPEYRMDGWGNNHMKTKENDNLTIILDCDDWKLSFKLNNSDKCHGNKPISIDPGKYHLVFYDNQILESHLKLISYNYC